MEMLDRNLDAYRIVAEILATLRANVHRRLAARHGEDWYRTGLPEGILERLIERKEKEKTIDWYDSEYQQLIDFATFAELLEVLVAEPDLVPGISKLAPNPPLLHARLLELDVLREKLALARPISENELSFLGTFYLRFRQAAQDEEKRSAKRDEAQPAEESDDVPDESVATTKEAAPDEAPPAPDEKPATSRPKPKPVKPVVPPSEASVSKKDGPAETRRTQADAPAEADETEDEEDEVSVAALEHALEKGDTNAVLRGLYHEVIEIAEGLWTSEVPVEPEGWETVRSSDWYARSFSSLGLQPLSDFYQVVDAVREMMEDGLARDQVQELLKERNFASVLLSLRDMFQKHNI